LPGESCHKVGFENVRRKELTSIFDGQMEDRQASWSGGGHDKQTHSVNMLIMVVSKHRSSIKRVPNIRDAQTV